jgi:hypothetical protein
MSLRQKVFKFIEQNDITKLSQVLKVFPEENKGTIKRYYYMFLAKNKSDITEDLKINIDTIKEMELTIQQIKDPVKRAENLARLHNMKLKPIANKEEKTLKELFDAQ